MPESIAAAAVEARKSRFILSLNLFAGLMLLGTVGYMLLTESSAFDSLYMTIVSITTVGYGEMIDIKDNPLARLFTMFLLISGAGITVYVASNLTAFLVEGELSNLLWSRKMEKQIQHLSQHMIIVGGGQTALYAIQEMITAQRAFVVIEKSSTAYKKLVLSFPRAQILGVIGDATDDQVLINAGIDRAEGLMSTLPDDKDNLFVTISARGLNSRVRIIAKIVRQTSASKMRMAGADEVVCPDSIGGLRMVSQLLRPHVVSFLDTMVRFREDEDIRIEEIRIRNPLCIGKSIAELNLPEEFGNMLVLALRQADHTDPVYNPKDTNLLQDDVLIVMGKINWIAKARAYLSL